MHQYSTLDEAKQREIIDAIEANPDFAPAEDFFDIDGIADAVIESTCIQDETTGIQLGNIQYQVKENIDADAFWAVVQEFAY